MASVTQRLAERGLVSPPPWLPENVHYCLCKLPACGSGSRQDPLCRMCDEASEGGTKAQGVEKAQRTLCHVRGPTAGERASPGHQMQLVLRQGCLKAC